MSTRILIGDVFDRHFRHWTAEDDAKLKALIESGVSYRKAGKELGCTASSISGRVRRLGLKSPEETQKRRFNDRTGQTWRPKPPPSAPQPIPDFCLNGEPLQFAEVDRPCARCAVREGVHHEHGCGQFAAEVRVRVR